MKMSKEEIVKRLLDLDDELWTLTRHMTALMIPYNPRPNNMGMELIRKNNPRGYRALIEYVALDAEEKMLKKRLERME